VADEVSTGEHARRLDEIRHIVQRLPTREEFTGEQRLTERRFTEIERDVAELVRRVDGDVKDLRARMDERDKASSSNVRQAIYAGLIPSALFLITILLQLKGGQ
jgi:hypothetical protein